ncbi:MAG: lysine--tRNA ligase [Gemmatimonadetes bacterium 13_2_20CM_2_65_7]|nr:MAG: lysine--tRNA ligase [Gemmatimonadetes bacterium 13_2_20CM_2_65_7]
MTGFVEAARREKLKELIERGVAPFAYRFDRSATANAALAAYRGEDDQTRYSLAGRLVALRPHGKTTFAHLEDSTGKIQLYFKGDELGADQYGVVELLDLGDHLGVEGRLMKTRTGEITLRVARFTLLAKALRPLPLGKEDASGVKHGELTDPELRYRQRYADLAVHPEVREVFRLRTRIVQGIRSFLDAKGYLEVETPVLQPLYGGATATPFKTHYEALDTTFYLRIADELYLKRCLVGGLESVYEIGHDFRNEGLSRFHNPEFTMAEWYQAYADYNDMAELTEEMLAALVLELFGSAMLERHGATLSFARPFARKDYYALVREHAGLDLGRAQDAELRDVLKRHNTPPAEVAALNGPKLVDEVFKTCVEPKLVQPTFVFDYPLALSPLAKPKRGDPTKVERWELFVQHRELANAFSELNDPDEQRRRFEQQGVLRAAGDVEAQQLDEDFLRALEYGMPPAGGVGLGVDRLTMILADQTNIRDVILFPMLRPE